MIALYVGGSDQTATSIYVSPNGNDLNSGTAAEPFRTLGRARDAVRAIKHRERLMRPIEVRLHGGVYRPERTLTLLTQDSGSTGAPIRFCAVPGETPVITGGRVIGGWQPLADKPAGVSELAKGKLWFADIPKGWRFHTLFVDGKGMQRAQMSSDFWRRWPKAFTPGPPEKAGQLLTFRDKGILKNLPSNGDVEMVCILAQYGVMGNGVLTDIDPARGTARWNSHQLELDFKGWSRSESERGFNLENGLPFLNKPGEWCVDSESGRVYLWPLSPSMKNHVVTAPKLYELVRIQGDETHSQPVHDVEFRGITFTCTDRLPENEWPHDWLKRQWEHVDAAVYVQCARDCSFSDNRILDSGASGITLNHFAQRIGVVGNEIGWPGSDGIFLEGYGPGMLDVNRSNTVRRNWIHDVGQGNYWHSASIQIYQSANNQIELNLLQRSAYCAVSIVGASPADIGDPRHFFPHPDAPQFDPWNTYNIRWQDFPKDVQASIREGRSHPYDRESAKPYLHSNGNLLTDNIVVEPEMLLDEGGAIYAWCPGKGNVWADNLIFKSSGMPGSSILALDDMAEYFTVSRNVIWVEGQAACGTIGVRPSERGNVIFGNVRACYKPEFADGDAGNLNGIEHGFYINDPSRAPVYRMLASITDQVKREGGWLGSPAVGIPRPGEKVTPVNKKVSGSPDHKTIEPAKP